MKSNKLKNKGYILLYDLQGLPARVTIAEILNHYRQYNIIYYCGRKPQIAHLGGNKNKKILSAAFIDLDE